MSEDEDVSRAVSAALAASGVRDRRRTPERSSASSVAPSRRAAHLVQPTEPRHSVDATVAVVAVGWVAATAGLNLDRAGVRTDGAGVRRGGRPLADHRAAHLRRRRCHRTRRWSYTRPSARRWSPRPTRSAERQPRCPPQVSPIGSFTDPEYASVGLTEAAAREGHDVAVATVRFDSLPRPIIDGRQTGFCKLIVDRQTAPRFSAATSWENGRSSSRSWRRRRWLRRCLSSNSHSSPIRFPPTRTRSAARLSAPPSNSTRPEGGRSITWQIQSRSAANHAPPRRHHPTADRAGVRPLGQLHRRKTLATHTPGTSRPGIRVGSVSEFSLFFRVRPGSESDLRKAVEALHGQSGLPARGLRHADRVDP